MFFNLRDISYTEEEPRKEGERRRDGFGWRADVKERRRIHSAGYVFFNRVPVA